MENNEHSESEYDEYYSDYSNAPHNEDAEFDTEYRDSVICPHCGYVQTEIEEYDWDWYSDDLNECQCQNCDKDFGVSIHVSYSFTSTK